MQLPNTCNPCRGTLPQSPGPRTLHKEGSSNQLFVLLEDQDSTSQQFDVAAPTINSMSPSSVLNTATQSNWGCGPKLSLLAAGFVTFVVVCVAVTFGRQIVQPSIENPVREMKSTQQKDLTIGTPHVPEELPSPPQQQTVFIGHPAYHCTYSMSPKCPAKELFWNPDIYEVATENLIQIGRGLLVHADRDTVRTTVAAGFKNISHKLQKSFPDVAKKLATLELSEKQKNTVLSTMRLIGIPEVQRIGYEVSLAIRHSLSLKKELVKQTIENTLRSNSGEIKKLRDELVSSTDLGFLGNGHQWDMTLDMENLQIMEAFHDGKFFGSMNASFFAEFHPSNPKKIPLQEKAYGAWGGVLEEARALLYIIKLLADSHGMNLHVPMNATSLGANVDIKDLGSELLSCELHSADGMNNLMKTLFCPLKYGTQGLDALRAIDHLTKQSFHT